MRKHKELTRIWACVENKVHRQLVCVKEFSDASTSEIAHAISAWLGITDISNVYQSIKGNRHHAYRHPETREKLLWINPDDRRDLDGKAGYRRMGMSLAPPLQAFIVDATFKNDDKARNYNADGTYWEDAPCNDMQCLIDTGVDSADALAGEIISNHAEAELGNIMNGATKVATCTADRDKRVINTELCVDFSDLRREIDRLVADREVCYKKTEPHQEFMCKQHQSGEDMHDDAVDAQRYAITVGKDMMDAMQAAIYRAGHMTLTQRSQGKLQTTHTQQVQLTDKGDFTMVVFSDSHVIPRNPSLASKALIKVLEQVRPEYVVCLGDTFDFASISKHAKSGWEKRFSVAEELEAGCDLLKQVVQATPNSVRVLTFSNHDGRYDGILAAKAPEFEGVAGFSLRDHIGKDWQYGISMMVNEKVMLKHQWHGGVHGAWNNVLKSGISIITGHTHKQGCKPYTDYTGTRFGVEVGTLSEIDNAIYNYTEHAPVDWISGFTVLTFKQGKLITPEFVSILNGMAYFRGEVIVL